jgi:hypothetical protein
MVTPPTNVERLRQAGVLPQDATIAQAQENAINALTVDEINAVLEVHKKVGTIEVPAPMWVIKIF